MAVDVSLRTEILTLTSLPVVQDVVSEDISTARVWYQRQNMNADLFIGGAPGLIETVFTVEVISTDIDQTQTEAGNIRAGLNGFTGTMGTDRVLAVFVQDSADDYQPKNLNVDAGYHIASFQVQIFQ